MIVIFEGPDGSGKTTLATAVADAADCVYIHASAPERHPLVEYTAPLSPDEDYVLDRWHIGEMIYGPLYRGESGLTQEQFWAVEQYLDDMGAIIIHCNGPTGILRQRLIDRGTDEKIPDLTTLRSEAQRFEKFLKQGTWLPVFQSPVEVPMTVDEIIAEGRAQEAKRALPSQ